MDGGVLSAAVAVKVQVLVFPEASVAVRVTTLLPVKRAPGKGD